MGAVGRWLRAISIDQWRAIDAECAATPRPRNPHAHVLIVLVVCAGSLAVQDALGGADQFTGWFADDGSRYWQLRSFAWWSGMRVFGYVVLPVIALAALDGDRVRDCHLRIRGFFRHLWIYGLMFVALSPIVLAASTADTFRATYPFYRLANRSVFDLAAWEVMYIVQFVALEFFFRGFLLRTLGRVMGANAIFVMIVPYCMIHFGKPLPETIGAIGAGLVLGTLAMRTRSIWGGVLIHVAVALTMDVLALRGCPPFGSGLGCGP